MKALSFAIILILASLTAIPRSWATVPDSAKILAEYYTELSHRRISEHQDLSAADELLRALALNPVHEKASQQLSELLANGDFQESERLKKEYLREIADYIRFVLVRIQTLLAETKETTIFLKNYSLPAENPDSEGDRFSNELTRLDNAIATIFKDISEQDLLAIETVLNERKAAVLALLPQVQALNTQARERKHVLLKQATDWPQQNRAKLLTDRLKDSELTLIRKEQIVAQQEKNISLLKDELKMVKNEFATLQTRFSDAETRINDLTHDLAGMTMEVFQRDQTLAQKEKSILGLNEELADLHQRGELMQRLIREKELSRLDAVSKLGPDQKTAELQQQLKALREDYDVIVKKLSEREKVLKDLGQQLASRDATIADLKRSFIINQKRVSELLGVVEIYQGKLGETLKSINGIEQRLDLFEAKQQDIPPDPLVATLTSHGLNEQAPRENLSTIPSSDGVPDQRSTQ